MNRQLHARVSQLSIIRPLASVLAAAVFSLALSGCGGSGLVPVTGTVKLDGKLIDRGNVTFQPVGGGTIGAAKINQDGSFQVYTGSEPGLAPGEYVVLVVALESMPEPTMENPAPKVTHIVPTRYGDVNTSGLKRTITADTTEVLLELTTEPTTAEANNS